MAHIPDAEKIYKVADTFRERCLVGNQSLLWPNHSAWSLENLDSFWNAFVGRLDESSDSFITKWTRQLSDQSDDVHRIATDISAIYCLFPSKSSMGPASKKRLITDVRNIRAELSDPDDETWESLMNAIDDGIGAPGQHYLTGRPFHMAFYLGFARRLKATGSDPYNHEDCRRIADEVRAEVKAATNHQPSLSRNMLLHLLFPDEYERISSDDHKHRIFNTFASEAGLASDMDVDAGLLAIRRRIEADTHSDTFDFYEHDSYSRWNPSVPDPVVQTQPDEPESVKSSNGRTVAPASPSLDNLIDTIHMSQDIVDEINDLLLTKRQLILEGPPGSGKTFVAEKFARWFTGQPLDADRPLNEQVEIVQFHQSYGYEDFVQGIRPETNEQDQLVYRVKDGIFLKMCERATANPTTPFVLIIDEINRGNLSRIFGELLLLLEYRGMTARLPYGTGDAAQISIPDNLYIIGMMNTADRSLAQIDYALRRRFYFVRFMPVENGRAEVFENWLAMQKMSAGDCRRLAGIFVNLNHGIREYLNTDDLQVGHSYFMQDDIATEGGFNRVWNRAVAPLLNEYLHHHRNREEILAALTPRNLLLPEQEVEMPVDDNAGALDPELV